MQKLSDTPVAQVTTFGKKGAVLLDRRPALSNHGNGAGISKEATLDSVIASLFQDLDATPSPDRATDKPSCIGHNDTPIFSGNTTQTSGLVRLHFDRTQSKEKAKLEKALQATTQEASATGQQGTGYVPELATLDDNDSSSPASQELTVQARACP